MAEKISIKADTMRKYIGPDGDNRGGYQPCSEQILNTMALVASYEERKSKPGTSFLNDAPLVSDLEKSLDVLQTKIDRLIYSIRKAKRAAASSGQDSESAEILDHAEGTVDAKLQSAKPKSKKGLSSRGVSPGSNERPSVPKKGPS